MSKYFPILLLAGLLFSCKSKQKAFSPSSFKTVEQGVIEGDALIIEASKEKNRENFDKAIQLYEAALKKPGNKAPVYYELAQLAYNYEHNYAKALGYINQALDIDESNKWYLYFYLQINEENGQPQLVEKGYKKLISLFPDNTQYQLELADYYISRKAYEKALSVYDAIESRIGPQAAINRNKFLIHRGRKRYPEAILELKKLISLDPTAGEYYSDLVDIYRIMNLPDSVEATYLEALDRVLLNTAIKDEYGHYLFLKNRRDSAYRYQREVLLDETYEVRHKAEIIDLYVKFERIDAKYALARIEFCHLLDSLHSDDFLANLYLGELADRNKEHKIAQGHYLKAVNLNGSSFEAWQNLLIADQQLEETDSVIRHAKEAINYFPAQAQFYLYLGSAYSQQKKHNLAIETLEEGMALSSNPKSRLYFHVSLADAYHEVGKHQLSDAQFEKALQIDSTNALVLNNYAYYLSERNERLEEALAMSYKSNILSPGSASFNDTYGWILFLKQDFQAGLEWLLKAERNGGDKSAVILEHIGDVYKEMGNIEQARLYYQKAIDAGGERNKLVVKMNSI